MRAWLLLLGLACGSTEGAVDAPGAAEPAGEVESAVIPVATPRPCERVFSPTADLLELTESAAQQWSEATGCNVHVGDGGVPLRFVERILNAAGEPQCGVTHRLRDEAGTIMGAKDIEISNNRADRCHLTARDVLHEMGHALAPRRVHTTEGIMAPSWNATDYVDDVSARFVCEELGC